MYRSLVQRPVWYRVLVGLWGLWFITALTAPAVLQACPVHADHMGHAAPMSGAMHHSHQMAPSRPLGAGLDAEHAHLDEPAQHTGSCCTCLGSCCCSATLATAGSAGIPLPPIVRAAHVLPVAYAMPARTPVAHAHPFAHAPPIVSETLHG